MCLLTWLHSPSGLRFYWVRITGFWIFMPPGVGHVNTLLQSLRSWLEWVIIFFITIQPKVPVTSVMLKGQWAAQMMLRVCDWQILKGKVRAGKIDCQAHQHTCQTAGISSYPTVRFYPYVGTQRVTLSLSFISELTVKCIGAWKCSCGVLVFTAWTKRRVHQQPGC